MRILLIGAGNIANEYAKALTAIGHHDIGVLSRRLESAQDLATRHGLHAAYGGGEAALPALLDQYDAFIVGTPIDTLQPYAELLAAAGKNHVLIEKPSFLYSSDLESFLSRYPSWNATVALNRLHYPSVQKLREHLATETITSAEFSFTEWVHRIDTSLFSPLVLERWGLSNCIHVIATAFELIGLPATLHAAQHGAGDTPWHPHGSVFSGSGVSVNAVPFTYLSDWSSAGRWSITIRTRRGSYQLCPMEGLEFTPKGSVTKETLLPSWNSDIKCGFEPMLQSWLKGEGASLQQLLPHMRTIEQIFGYAPHA